MCKALENVIVCQGVLHFQFPTILCLVSSCFLAGIAAAIVEFRLGGSSRCLFSHHALVLSLSAVYRESAGIPAAFCQSVVRNGGFLKTSVLVVFYTAMNSFFILKIQVHSVLGNIPPQSRQIALERSRQSSNEFHDANHERVIPAVPLPQAQTLV